MAQELEKLAHYYTEQRNQPRANLYKALAAEERAIGGPETVVPVEKIISEQSAVESAKTSEAFKMPANVYVIKSVEGLTLPKSDQLVTASTKELKDYFGINIEVPTPPVALFETLEAFAKRGIERFDEVYYLKGMRFDKNDKFWQSRGRVKPEDYFWEQIKNNNYPPQVAELEEGWYIGDRRGKPQYDNGQQMYEDDYLAPLMEVLRSAGKIEKYGRVPAGSRFVTSPREIEDVILPTFKEMSGAQGIVRMRRYIEFNVRGNIAYPEWGKTNTWEWFADPAYQGASRLLGGGSGRGGLASVVSDDVDDRRDDAAFSPVIFFPSKA